MWKVISNKHVHRGDNTNFILTIKEKGLISPYLVALYCIIVYSGTDDYKMNQSVYQRVD